MAEGEGGEGELEITAELVGDLLRDQHPDLADRPITVGAHFPMVVFTGVGFAEVSSP